MKPNWRVRYCDGAVLDDLSSAPGDVPARGVQTIVQWVDGHRQILQGFALYYWMADLDCWWAGDVTGFLELAECDARVQYPKRGLNCVSFQAILDATVTDPDFDPGLRAVTPHD
jgi:hypothetical protein